MSKVKVILAEAAAAHPDGTISLLRAGINKITAQNVPFMCISGLALVLRLETELSEAGQKHSFLVRVLTADGKDIIPSLHGQFIGPHGGGASNMVLNISQMSFPSYGRYGVYVNIDGSRQDDWYIDVIKPDQKEKMD